MAPWLTVQAFEEKTASWLTAAEDWKAKANVAMEISCLGAALDLLLTIAVAHHDSVEAGTAYLRARHCGGLLARYHALDNELLQTFLGGSRDVAVPDQVAFAHLGWLLEEHALGDAVLAIVCNPDAAKVRPKARFWDEYRRGIACLVSRTPYTPQAPPKLKGYEKHWAAYLDLVAALTTDRDPSPELAACAASFARRNRDKRLNAFLYDGSGHEPVRWDFRLASTLARWRHRPAR